MTLARSMPAFGALVAGAALSSPALAAGTVDYGAFEELFNEPVTTSATGAPQRATEVPVGMHIITQEQIQRSGAVDIPGVLEGLAVLDVDRPFRGAVDVSVRGYNTPHSPRLLVLLNGRQVYLDHFGKTNWDLIPVQLSEIRQIELVTGPNTALFGFNAVAGVINIITFDALNDDADAVDVTIGSKEYLGASAVITHRLLDGDLGVRVGVGGFNADGFEGEAQFLPFFEPLDPLRRSASIAAAYQLSPDVRVDLEGTWSLNQRTDEVTFALANVSTYEAFTIRAGVAAETDLGLVEGLVYSNGLDVDYQLSVMLDRYIMENRITVADAALISKPGSRHVWRNAVEYRRNTYQQFPFGLGVTAYSNYAFSTSWTWRITDALSATSALRIDHFRLGREGDVEFPGLTPFSADEFDQRFTEPSFNAGLVWKPSQNDTLRVTAARGVQSPSLLNLGLEYINNNPAIPFGVFGQPDTGPTIVYNAELGWDRELPKLNSRLRSVLFAQRNLRLQSLGSEFSLLPDGTPVLLAGETGSSDALGGEIDFSGERGAWNWRLGYSYRNINDALELETLGTPNDFESNTPGSIATGGVGYRRGAWDLGLDARYVGSSRQFLGGAGFALTPVGDYVLLNSRIGYEVLDGVTVAISGRNLLNNATQTTAFTPLERTAFLTLSARF